MKSPTIIAAMAGVALCLSAGAQSRYYAGNPPPELFTSQELSLDLFGSLSIGQQTIDNLSGSRVTNDGRLGTGLGVNYYFNRYYGIMADAYTENTDRSFVDNTSVSFVARLPFESAHLAPYVFGGGGHQFDPKDKWFAQVGAGLDVRVTRHWGLFADARYMILEGPIDNVGLGRAGVRFVF